MFSHFDLGSFSKGSSGSLTVCSFTDGWVEAILRGSSLWRWVLGLGLRRAVKYKEKTVIGGQ